MMAASKPTSYLSKAENFLKTLSIDLGTLSGGQTANPVATVKLCPHGLTTGNCAAVFVVWLVSLPLLARQTIQSSTPATTYRRCP